MDARQRFINTLKFIETDRIPLVEWPIREATLREWIKQGFPEDISPREFYSMDTIWIKPPIKISMHPFFDEKIIEEDENYKIWIDSLGAMRRDFKDEANPGFVTRSWLRHPVQSREDFNEMKKRYNAADPERFPIGFHKIAEAYNNAMSPVVISVPFLFWTARDWLGFENLCMSFYDNPSLLHEMFEYITDFAMEVMKRAYEYIKIDAIELEEDMAYKGAPMVSPDMFREFMLPHYRRFIDFAKSNGTEIITIDCDGYPGGLIPLWIEAGADAMSPCEIAAGVDLFEIRRQYPGFGLLGGIDKRELAKSRRHIYEEVMGKVPRMIEKGGYIPHVDHAVPYDVSFENYSYFRQLMDRVAYGKTAEKPRE